MSAMTLVHHAMRGNGKSGEEDQSESESRFHCEMNGLRWGGRCRQSEDYRFWFDPPWLYMPVESGIFLHRDARILVSKHLFLSCTPVATVNPNGQRPEAPGRAPLTFITGRTSDRVRPGG